MASGLKGFVTRISQLFGSARTGTDSGAVPLKQLTVTEVLAALPADAPAEVREAIRAGCCIHYYVSEGSCGSGGCGSGWCCYHIVSSCGPNYYQCLNYPCAHGNFSTGC